MIGNVIYAQVSFDTGQYLNQYFVPRSLSSTGQAVLTVSQENEGTQTLTCYNSDLIAIKNINLALLSSTRVRYTETATAESFGSTNLVWKKEDEGKYTEYYGALLAFFTNLDEDNNVSICSFFLSQTLFNDDDKWEYVIPILEEVVSYDRVNSYKNEDDGMVHFFRGVERREVIIGFKVLSEDGTTIMSIRYPHADNINNGNYSADIPPSFIIWEGKVFLEVYENYSDSNGDVHTVRTYYLLNSNSTSIKQVASMEMKPRLATVSDSTIHVKLADDNTGSDIILTNMAGQMVGQKHVSAGETEARMSAAGMAKGIYNLIQYRDGKVLNSQKLMVK